MVKEQMVLFLSANQLQFMLAIAHFALHEYNNGFALILALYCLWCQNWYLCILGTKTHTRLEQTKNYIKDMIFAISFSFFIIKY